MAPWPPMMMMASMSNSWSICIIVFGCYHTSIFERFTMSTLIVVNCHMHHRTFFLFLSSWHNCYMNITINRCLISMAHDYGMLEGMKIIYQWLHSLGKKALISLTYITQLSSCRKSWRIAWAGGCLAGGLVHTGSLSQRLRQWQVL